MRTACQTPLMEIISWSASGAMPSPSSGCEAAEYKIQDHYQCFCNRVFLVPCSRQLCSSLRDFALRCLNPPRSHIGFPSPCTPEGTEQRHSTLRPPPAALLKLGHPSCQHTHPPTSISDFLLCLPSEKMQSAPMTGMSVLPFPSRVTGISLWHTHRAFPTSFSELCL